MGGGPRTLKTKHLSRLMYKLKRSGYDQDQRMEILVAGLRGYRKMERDEIEGIRPINRFGWMGSRTRRLKKLVGKKL